MLSGSTILAARWLRQNSDYGEPATCNLGIHQPASGASRERGRHVSCGEPAIVKWINSESVRAPIFFMAVARWVSTVLWLIPRT